MTYVPTGDFQFVGKTEAFHIVDIRARVTGFLDEKNFAEGQNIDKDALRQKYAAERDKRLRPDGNFDGVEFR